MKNINYISLVLLALVIGCAAKGTAISQHQNYRMIVPSDTKFKEGLAPVSIYESQGNEWKWGYIDKTGKLVISPQYGKAEPFYEGLAQINNDGKIGFIDRNGSIIIPTKFSVSNTHSGLTTVWSFSEGLALVCEGRKNLRGYKYGFINRKGEFMIPLQYDYASSFSEGLAKVMIGDKIGFINKNGMMIIQFPRKELNFFNDVGDFSEGLAKIVMGKRKTEGGAYSEWGFIDRTGKQAFPDKYLGRVGDFKEGLALAGDIQSNAIRKGFINKNGRFVIQPQFDDAEKFSEGLAKVRMGQKFGFIDRSGKMIIPIKFEAAGNFNDGLARVKIGGKWTFIKKNGELIAQPQFDYAIDFSEGLALVNQGENGLFIDKEGKVVIGLNIK